MNRNQDIRHKWKRKATNIMMAIVVTSLVFPVQIAFAAEIGSDAASSQIIVSTEAELIDAVNASSTEASERTQIVLDADIALTKKLVIPAGHYVAISGDRDGRKLSTKKKFSDSQLNPAGVMLVKGDLTVENLEINGSELTRSIAVYDGVLTLNEGALITGAKILSHMDGGGLYIADNTATKNKATLTINEGASISNNIFNPSTSVEASGIGLYIEQASVVMNGGEISGNRDNSIPVTRTRAGNGGAVGISGSKASFTMNGGSIENNLVQGNGGAITATNAAKVILNDGTIRNNTCYGVGGAVYLTTSGAGGSSFEMNGGEISGNLADATNSAPDTDKSLIGSGGAVFLESSTFMSMTGGTISDNTAKALPIADTNGLDGGQGGGIYVEGTLEMSGGTITANHAIAAKSDGYKTGNGGGIAVSGGTEPGTVSITGGTIRENTATLKGLDLYINYDKRSANLMSVGSALLTTEAQGKLAISGEPEIGNLYLPESVEFAVTGSIDSAKIGVESEKKEIGTVVASGDGYKILADDARNLTNEEGKNVYDLEKGKVVLVGERTYTDLSDGVVEVVEDQIYTGNAITPEPELSLNGDVLTAGEDFQYLYANNVNAGEAELTVSGIGVYSGSVQTSFTILPKDLGDVTIEGLQPYLFYGEEVIPELLIKDGSTQLIQDTDYSLTYRDNTRIGTAGIVITGKGNYTGTKEETFSIISPEDVTVCTDEDSLRAAVENAEGTEDEPEIIYVAGGIVLTHTLVIPDDKHIQLIGSDKNAGLVGQVFSAEDNEEDDPLIPATAGINKTSMIRVKGDLRIERLILQPDTYQKANMTRLRAIRIDQDAELTLGTGACISGGYGYVGSGLFNRGNTQINGAVFQNNCLTDMTNGLGGAIVNDESGVLTITAGIFTDNMSRKGGAIYNAEGAEVYISGGIFQDNEATSDQGSSVVLTGEGAAIYNDEESYLQISGGSFQNNAADDYGGAIANYGTMDLLNGDIAANTAEKCGAGIYTAGTTTFEDGTIRSNTIANSDLYFETADGGGVFVAKGTFTMNGGTISDNTVRNDYNSLTSYASLGNGGGVYVSNSADGSRFIMHGGTIRGNEAGSYLQEAVTGKGGGVYVAGGSGTAAADRQCEPGHFLMDGGTITGNTASGSGDGIYVSAQCSYNYEENRVTYIGEKQGAASVTIAGEAVITENQEDNLYLEKDVVASITDSLKGSVFVTAQQDADAMVFQGTDYQLTQEDAAHVYTDETERTIWCKLEENVIYLWANHLEDTYELVTKDSYFVYTGENVCPEIEIREIDHKEHVLKEGTDYTVTYTNADGKERTVDATDADGDPYYITVTGCGNYAGELVQTYEVEPANLSLVEVNLPDQTYTGKEIKYIPNLGEITYNGRALSRNDDYFVIDESYSENTNVGTASFQIIGNRDQNGNGSGNYTGVRTVQFRILPDEAKPGKTDTSDDENSEKDSSGGGTSGKDSSDGQSGDRSSGKSNDGSSANGRGSTGNSSSTGDNNSSISDRGTGMDRSTASAENQSDDRSVTTEQTDASDETGTVTSVKFTPRSTTVTNTTPNNTADNTAADSSAADRSVTAEVTDDADLQDGIVSAVVTSPGDTTGDSTTVEKAAGVNATGNQKWLLMILGGGVVLVCGMIVVTLYYWRETEEKVSPKRIIKGIRLFSGAK